jgi:hypothetical protein
MAARLVMTGKIKAGFTTERIDNRFGSHDNVVAADLPEWNPRKQTQFPKLDDPNYPESRGKWAEEQIALGAGEDI